MGRSGNEGLNSKKKLGKKGKKVDGSLVQFFPAAGIMDEAHHPPKEREKEFFFFEPDGKKSSWTPPSPEESTKGRGTANLRWGMGLHDYLIMNYLRREI